MNNFDRLLNRIVTVLTGVGCIFMVLVMMIVVTNIVTRMFGKAILGTYEGVQLGIVVMVAFAMCYTAIKKGHIDTDTITSRLSKSPRRILYIINSFLHLGIWGLIAWYTYEFALEETLIGEHTIIMEWPIYPFRYIFALGAIILCLVILADILQAIREQAK